MITICCQSLFVIIRSETGKIFLKLLISQNKSQIQEKIRN